MSYKAWYNEDADYNTNARSYMDYLARHNKFMKVLVEDYEVFKELLTEEFKQFQLDTDETIESFQTRLDNIQQEMTDLFIDWLEDGTIEKIINEEIFTSKADITYVDGLNNILLDRLVTLETKQKAVYLVTDLGIQDGDELTGTEHLFHALPKGSTVVFERGATYTCRDGLHLTRPITLDFNGSTILYNKNTATLGLGITLSAPEKTMVSLTGDYAKGEEWLSVSDSSQFEVGDVFFIDSPEQYNDSREYYKKGGSFIVSNIDGSRIRPHRQLPFTLGAGSTIHVYEAVNSHVKNVHIENIGTLERGCTGLQLRGLSHSTVENVTVDKFNINIRVIKCVNTELTRVTPLRSYYNDSPESYGVQVFESTGTNIRNSILVSGRHGLSVSGFKPSYDTYLENCTFGTEDQSGVVGLDHHDSSFNSVVVNCVTHGARLAGNVVVQNVHFMRDHLRGKNILLGRGMEYDHSNYTFTDCYFADHVVIRINAGRDNPEATNRRIGKIVIRNAITKKLDVTLLSSFQESGLLLNLLHITGSNNVTLKDLKGQIDLLIMEKMTSYVDAPFITTELGSVNIINMVLRDLRLTGGSGLYMRVHRIGKLLMDNVQLAGDPKALHFSNGDGVPFKASIRHCDLESNLDGIRFDHAGIVSDTDNEHFKTHVDSTVTLSRKAQYS